MYKKSSIIKLKIKKKITTPIHSNLRGSEQIMKTPQVLVFVNLDQLGGLTWDTFILESKLIGVKEKIEEEMTWPYPIKNPN